MQGLFEVIILSMEQIIQTGNNPLGKVRESEN